MLVWVICHLSSNISQSIIHVGGGCVGVKLSACACDIVRTEKVGRWWVEPVSNNKETNEKRREELNIIFIKYWRKC